MKKILFYPGTFNPPHFGHVSAIQVAVDNLDFDEVWIMSSGKRLDKIILTNYEDRRNLANIFIEYLRTLIQIPIKLVGADFGDSRYTHEIIMELKSQTENEIYQLVGIDGYTSIKERVIGPNEKFVIIKRSGYKFPEKLTSNGNLIFLDEGVAGLSSTKIREMVKTGDEKWKELVPGEIAAYIIEKSLYL
jgi:nicotinate-nucleotide adenylyltransferase